ncbi:hypothetical protein K438DRAFT_2029629 [Mycena galopus ATCC 62051]|nr:hypothetical protein K438DRAFT_2029629 [Mycena galopus ATCC 62051]
MFLTIPSEDPAEEETFRQEMREIAAKVEELKMKGNDAFKRGEYKTAYVLYTACLSLRHHDSKKNLLYHLNRAAVALKLKMYDEAAKDASETIMKGDKLKPGQLAKAYFRRGQAMFFLGDWTKAEDDYTKALTCQPGEPTVVEQVAEIKRMRGLSTEEQTAWKTAQTLHAATLEMICESDAELRRLVEEVLGHSIAD